MSSRWVLFLKSILTDLRQQFPNEELIIEYDNNFFSNWFDFETIITNNTYSFISKKTEHNWVYSTQLEIPTLLIYIKFIPTIISDNPLKPYHCASLHITPIL